MRNFVTSIQTLPQKFSDSAKEFHNIRSLTGMAMLLAVSIILSFFTIRLTDNLKVGLGFLVTAMLGALYGPVAAGVAAATGDIIKYLLKPIGAYFPGFTITALLGGVIYGMFFYKSRCTIPKAIVAKLSVTLFLNCFLNTLWNSILYGTSFGAILIPRVIKNLTALPIEIILLYITLTTVPALLSRSRAQSK